MGCNCGKKKVLNNLNSPSYVQLAKDFITSIGNTPHEQLEEHQWSEAYHIYNLIFPNSKGQPSRPELLTIITNASQYKNKR